MFDDTHGLMKGGVMSKAIPSILYLGTSLIGLHPDVNVLVFRPSHNHSQKFDASSGHTNSLNLENKEIEV